MARPSSTSSKDKTSTATIGFGAKLRLTADKLRNNMDAAEYKHVVLANGSMFSHQSGEGEIRKTLIEAQFVDCMVALPGQLCYSTQIHLN